MTPSIYTWTSLGHLVTMLLQRHNPLIRELYLKHDQVPQKLTDNSGHMKIIGKCPILLLVTMTPIMMTMTQMLTLMSTKNGSKEEMDGTKQHEHLKKKGGPRYVLKHLGLIHACQEHLLSLQKLIRKQLCLQPSPYHLMQS